MMKSLNKNKNLNMQNDAILEVSSLYKKYGKTANFAIYDISFQCSKGEIVGVLGVNGAGKSTTLKCITGMIPITKGNVKICGYDIEKSPLNAKKNFSFVNDSHSVFVKMTGKQYLTFMADVYKVPFAERAELLEKLDNIFKLGDDVNKLIESYSHGMKQKICMMGSLMHKPKLWILDEPMIGLDPRTQSAVIDFMKEYVESGKTILFSSHNLDLVRRICDRVIIIKKGNLVADIVMTDDLRSQSTLFESYYIGD